MLLWFVMGRNSESTRLAENNFIIKKMFTRSHSYFFFVMPLFSRMDVFSFILIHILESF